jgi:cytochrome c553
MLNASFFRLSSTFVRTIAKRATVCLATCFLASLIGAAETGARATPQDTLSQRLMACTFCHGEQGRAGPDGYYPRLAGKPAGYLYNQLLNFKQGRREYKPMSHLLERLDDSYLLEIAEHFSSQSAPYPAPVPVAMSAQHIARAQQLVLRGDESKKIPACVACHGTALMGALPATPGLIGLPRDYLNAQMGAWREGARRAIAPDCMKEIVSRLDADDVAVLSGWLSSQPIPAKAEKPRVMSNTPMKCGSFAR